MSEIPLKLMKIFILLQEHKNILEIKSDQAESYQDVLDSVFSELMISNIQTKENLRKALDVSTIDKFNKDMVKKFIQANLSYYQ